MTGGRWDEPVCIRSIGKLLRFGVPLDHAAQTEAQKAHLRDDAGRPGAGVQTAAVQCALVNRSPSPASRLMFGVLTWIAQQHPASPQPATSLSM